VRNTTASHEKCLNPDCDQCNIPVCHFLWPARRRTTWHDAALSQSCSDPRLREQRAGRSWLDLLWKDQARLAPLVLHGCIRWDIAQRGCTVLAFGRAKVCSIASRLCSRIRVTVPTASTFFQSSLSVCEAHFEMDWYDSN